MFQTDINHLLQGLSTPWLDSFMIGVSWTGEQTFIVGLLCLVALGVDLRRGFLLVQIFLITIISTDILKTVFALPIPFFVDGSLRDFGALKEGMAALTDGAATAFLASLPESSIEAYRLLNLKPDDYGLPSGHTTGAVALWGGLAVVFRKNRLGLLAVVMIPLMMISRLYLARHFPADVMAGLGLGLFILILAAYLLNRRDWWRLFLSDSYSLQKGMRAWLLLGGGFLLPMLLLFSGEGHVGRIAALLAVNMALLTLIAFGTSFEMGTIWHRMLRAVLGFGLFFLMTYVIKLAPLPANSLATSVVIGFVPVFVLFVCAPLITGFFMQKNTEVTVTE